MRYFLPVEVNVCLHHGGVLIGLIRIRILIQHVDLFRVNARKNITNLTHQIYFKTKCIDALWNLRNLVLQSFQYHLKRCSNKLITVLCLSIFQIILAFYQYYTVVVNVYACIITVLYKIFFFKLLFCNSYNIIP